MEDDEQFPIARRIGTIIGFAFTVLVWGLSLGPLVYHYL